LQPVIATVEAKANTNKVTVKNLNFIVSQLLQFGLG
jgi:hypothetical protein